MSGGSFSNSGCRLKEAHDVAAVNGDGSTITRRGAEQLSAITGLALSTVTGVAAAEAGWRVEVEMVEKQSIPSSMDILGRYEIYLDDAGNLVGFERKGLRKRGDTDLE